MHFAVISQDRVLDRPIERAASRCLRASPWLAFAAITCQCDCGVLVLRGRTANFYHKQLAQEAVAQVQGVTQVINEIEVA